MTRAQSTVLGTIMLVAVVVVTVTTFGVFSIASMTNTTDGPAVEIEGTLDASGLTLAHAGGDAVEERALTVFVENDTTRSTRAFSDGTVFGDGDERFEPGERWRNSSALPAGDRLTVWLVHESSNSVLFNGKKSRVTTVAPPSDAIA